MYDYLFLATVLAAPFFAEKIKTHRKGLVTGLFISLFFWGFIHPLLIVVSFFAVICIYVCERHNDTKDTSPVVYIKNPAIPVLIIFIISMAVFCSLENTLHAYGNYLNFSDDIMRRSTDLSKLSCFVGPLYFGMRCDKKGPFGTAILLTLIAEISVLFAAAGNYNSVLFLTGNFFIHFCTSGFFVLVPQLIRVFFGQRIFFSVYPVAASVVGIIWFITRFLYTTRWAGIYNPGNFLIGLLVLTMAAAMFIFIAWKRRFTLIRQIQ